MSSLARNLRLTIEKEESLGPNQGEQLKITLSDPLAMREVQICYEIGSGTPNRTYHTREALVIAMRRLVSKAIEEKMIRTSGSPGVWTELSMDQDTT